MTDKTHDIVIIGAGPAGMAAAIQLSRYGFEPLIIEADRPGGLLPDANLIENYPGFPEGISGPELTALFVRQFKMTNPVIIKEEVTSVSRAGNRFRLSAGNQELSCRCLVIATGTKPREFPRSFDVASKHVCYDIRNILDKREKQIVIIGAGDIAFDYALNLAQKNKVTILNRSSGIRALPLLNDRIKKNDSITYLDAVKITSMTTHAEKQIELRYIRNEKEELVYADRIVFAIGRQPNLDFISPEIMEIKDKLIDDGLLYFIGDVKNGIYRQVSIATGQAVEAAMKIYRRHEGV